MPSMRKIIMLDYVLLILSMNCLLYSSVSLCLCG